MTESSAALVQIAVTLILAAVTYYLHRRFRKRYFAFWTVAWILYAARLVVILRYIAVEERIWLYWHQVFTGWTALALLWGAMSFSEPHRFRERHLTWLLFPLLWSAIAIYRLDNFLLAAGPAVLFLAIATWWTAWTFRRYARQAQSGVGRLLSVALVLWGLHHLDYPFLRARGAWNPWGYYLDIVFEIAVGTALLLLVVEDLHRGLGTLSALSRELHRAPRPDLVDALLSRVASLPGVEGALLVERPGRDSSRLRGVGASASWTLGDPVPGVERVVGRVAETGAPVVDRGGSPDPLHGSVAGLPVREGDRIVGVLVVVGPARDPFAALDRSFLTALGEQVGGALHNQALYDRLSERTNDLTRLAAKMVRQHETERQRLARELHDETAQVFSAVKLQVGVIEETVSTEVKPAVRDALQLLDQGIRSIRSVTTNLRPPILDDLGLLPALAALVEEVRSRSSLEIACEFPETLPRLSEEAELVLFRSLQEALSNVIRHAGPARARVRVRADGRTLSLSVTDDGRGFDPEGTIPEDRMGLTGMRERVTALGGELEFDGAPEGGAVVRVHLPIEAEG